MTERKKPGVAFWVTVVLIVALVGYPLSAGPVLWSIDKIGQPDWAFGLFRFVYGPLDWIAFHAPAWVQEPIEAYIDWWAPVG